MNTKMLEYEAKKVLEWALREREKQGTETARLSIRKNMKAETGCSSMHYEQIRDYLQGIGVAFFRTGPSPKDGTTVAFCETAVKKFMDAGKPARTAEQTDDIVYNRLASLGGNGKQFMLVSGDLSKDDVKPVELGKSLERMGQAGLITCRPLIIDEKWVVKLMPKEPEPTPKDAPLEKGKCPKCGTQLPDGAKYCFMCGERMPKTEAEQLKDRYLEVLSRVARMYSNSERAQKDIAILNKVADMAFKEGA